MCSRLFLCITAMLLFHPVIHAQASTQELPQAPEPEQSEQRVAAPDTNPEATLIPEIPAGSVVQLEADHQSREKNIIRLSGKVVIRYLDYVIRSEELVYNDATGTVKSAGQVTLDGGADNEHISADRAEMDLKGQTAHLYRAAGTITPPARAILKPGEAPSSAFFFTAQQVIKAGPGRYTLLGGVVTSCALPRPDWVFQAKRIEVNQRAATMYDSIFRLLNVPIVYFPYATHSLSTEGRQSGVLVPIVGISSTKGLVLGDEFYWAINRSMDLQLGLQYFSVRGFAPLGQVRYKGRNLDFAQFRFTALKDRGQPGTNINQGGEDLLLSGRHDFNAETRVAGNIEYLSSYIYRQAFAESFSQAVASEVKSDAFLAHESNGYAAMVSADRYQNFQNTTGEQIRILHVPTVEGDALDHTFGATHFYWGGRVASDGLERSEQGLAASHFTERVDLYPHAGYMLQAAGWTLRAEVGARETFYTRSGAPGALVSRAGDVVPTENNSALSRSDAEALLQVAAPAVERDYESGQGNATGGWQWRHVLQPEAQYRFVGGVHNFNQVLRFDATDIVSNTNEVEYGLSQRLYVKHHRRRPCKVGEHPATGEKPCGDRQMETVRWFVGQKYFFDPSFGGAVSPGFRNVLETTLNFSGTAFLTSQRNVSPVISRLRWSSTEKFDVQWDLDYDTKRGGLLSSNTFVDFRQREWFAGGGVSKLVQPDEQVLGSLAQQQDFLQLRWSLGYGAQAKRGLSVATSGGYDVQSNAVQYSVVQSGYNWDCCGFNAEYRRFALGSTRNENQYLFSFTLNGVGTAGNLKRSERLF